MLHLAQVKNNSTTGEIELQLLARQESLDRWKIILPYEVIFSQVDVPFNNGVLVLIELIEGQKIINIQEAKNWIIELVKNHLGHGTKLSDSFNQEQQQIENWRQEMTLKSLDLTRRHLELETQKEQLQELEANLKQQEELLNNRQKELKELETNIQKQEKL
ncbi:MAG TPA: hypothetical protein DCF68_14310 [Cyanothece sp. UBA12306]|nr:hypothetical protein [Cyanothece sp. UBA12306]